MQLPYTVINVWRGITVWELLTCETSHQSEILHSLIFVFLVSNQNQLPELARNYNFIFVTNVLIYGHALLKWCRNKRQYEAIPRSTCPSGSERRALDLNG